MTPVPTLSGELCVLRAVERSDVEARRAAGEHVEINRMYGVEGADRRALSVEEGEAWFADVAASPHEWLIAEGDQPRGQIRLHTIEGAEAFLAVGLWRPEWLGRGLGTDAIRTLSAWARGEPLALTSLKVRVAAFNERALAAYAGVGFVRVGTEPDGVHHGGRTYDDVILALDLAG